MYNPVLFCMGRYAKDMKKILFDLSVCQPIGNSKFHGGGIYGCIVAKKIIQEYPKQIGVIYDYSRFLSEDVKDLISERGIVSYNLVDTDRLSAFKDGGFERFYSPLYDQSYTSLMENGVDIMITVHGLRALEKNRDVYEWRYAQDFKGIIKVLLKWTPVYSLLDRKYRMQYKRLLDYERARIVTVSEHSKASLRFFFPNLKDERIVVRYSPNTSVDQEITANINLPFKIEGRYYLIVSANRWLKNSFRAIKAIEQLVDKEIDLKSHFVVVGINERHPIAKSVRHKKYFSFLDYVNQPTLNLLLKNAHALIYPTLNEGFGYPPLEAMRFGTPVLASAVTSIPEICSDAVLYFNPYSIDEIANRIIQMEDAAVHEQFVSRAKVRYAEVKSKQDIDLEKLIQGIIS